MKCHIRIPRFPLDTSPSMRREWIEISHGNDAATHDKRLPPCGGSGLKFPDFFLQSATAPSPSMRREWIEMKNDQVRKIPLFVSLHAEGVD